MVFKWFSVLFRVVQKFQVDIVDKNPYSFQLFQIVSNVLMIKSCTKSQACCGFVLYSSPYTTQCLHWKSSYEINKGKPFRNWKYSLHLQNVQFCSSLRLFNITWSVRGDHNKSILPSVLAIHYFQDRNNLIPWYFPGETWKTFFKNNLIIVIHIRIINKILYKFIKGKN